MSECRGQGVILPLAPRGGEGLMPGHEANCGLSRLIPDGREGQMSQQPTLITTFQQIDDLIRGLTLMGTGGGGRPAMGRSLLKKHIEAGETLALVHPSTIPDDQWTCSAFGMGSIAPPSGKEEEYARRFKVKRTVEKPMLKAVREIQEYLGRPISAIVPMELGAYNTAGALDAAMELGIPAVDGDYSGRAVPECSQSRFFLLYPQAAPAAICDSWGNVFIRKNVGSPELAEAMGKQLSVITKAPDPTATCGFADGVLNGLQMKKAVLPGTISFCLSLGETIRIARGLGEDPVSAAARHLKGWVLFRGIITRREWQSLEGYMVGTTDIEGSGPYSGQHYRIWYKNENHVTWLNRRPHAMSPDLIAVLQADDGEPLTNTEIQEGARVAVIGAPLEAYRTPLGLEALAPRHFGFDIDYVPIEEVLGQ